METMETMDCDICGEAYDAHGDWYISPTDEIICEDCLYKYYNGVTKGVAD